MQQEQRCPEALHHNREGGGGSGLSEAGTARGRPNPAAAEAGELEPRARRLGAGHRITRPLRRPPALQARLRELDGTLRLVYQRLERLPEKSAALSQAAEWFLDNYFILQETIQQIAQDMPEGYYRRLPRLAGSPESGSSRIHVLARVIVAWCDSPLSLDQVTQFITAYQGEGPLTMGELWALPTMLRLGVLESLVDAIAHLTGLGGPSRTPPPDSSPPATEADDAQAVANSILSLRRLSTANWMGFFEASSMVEGVLRCDPAKIYADMDFETRDRYRKVIEQLALQTGWEEAEVARQAIRLAEEAQQQAHGSARFAHVGYYLLDGGRTRLERSLGYRPAAATRSVRWLSRHATLIYLSSISLLSLAGVLGFIAYAMASGGSPVQVLAAGLLGLPLANSVAVHLVHWFVTHRVPPKVLARLDFRDGIPQEYRAIVAVPVLLGTSAEVKSLLRQLELHFLGNNDAHLAFALLTDFADSPEQSMPEDDALIEQLKTGIGALNQAHGHHTASPFYLFHRSRVWSPGEGCWMGWERKRGKLRELNWLLSGNGRPTSFVVQMGDPAVLKGTKFVITIDADTALPPGSARRLIGTLAHPLNRAEFDPSSGKLVAGYTVLQPRVEISPISVNRSQFARIFAGEITGLDLYSRAVSDVYQDLFGEGIFAGKGIYDVAAFERSLVGKVPDGVLLSHDLFEGIHGRAGLVTDVTLFEDFPHNYLAYARRTHRWVRGDWQLLPWLLPRVPQRAGRWMPSGLSVLDHWKILDNLRRSLLTPAVLTLLAAGWVGLPGYPAVWTLAGLLTTVVPYTGVLGWLRRPARERTLRGAAWARWRSARRWLLAVVFLPYEALMLIDAIGTTLARLVSRKHLLRWTPSAHTIRLLGKERKLGLFWTQMRGGTVLALGLGIAVGLLRPMALPVAGPILLAWVASPLIAHELERPLVRAQIALSAGQTDQLRRLARRTWRFFERFVGPDDHWLPPDHFQETPRGQVAHRTSPTNIGLLLLSTLGAYDLGYIGLFELTLRLRDAFNSIGKLERYRGHFLNWYDTRRLQALPPRYVSTVDSGNLAACLIAMRQGCLSLARSPILRWERWQGLLDALAILTEAIEGVNTLELEPLASSARAQLAAMCQPVLEAREEPNRWDALLVELLGQQWPQLNRLLTELVEKGASLLPAEVLPSLRTWLERIHHHLVGMQGDIDLFLPWLPALRQPPTLFSQPDTAAVIQGAWTDLGNCFSSKIELEQVADTYTAGQGQLTRLEEQLAEGVGCSDQVREAREWCVRLRLGLRDSRMAARTMLIACEALDTQAEAWLGQMDFGFLFDPQRHVFHIGYNVDAERLDGSYYDLLASEARIASLVAILKGDIPRDHWLHLSRPITRLNRAHGLLSWNGSMFEYLMPGLLMRAYEGSLLDLSCRAAVERQIAYGRRNSLPWGISESAYYRFDANLNYQYRAFGIPGLGLKRGLAEDLVVAPYASLLALDLDPPATIDNLARLLQRGMLGRYGLYEAIDFTRSRLPPGESSAIVATYMAHHQGMIFLSLSNFLLEGVMIHRFHADPRVQTTEMLLQEQVPTHAPLLIPLPREVERLKPPPAKVALRPWRAPVDGSLPEVNLLSNGRYSVMVTCAGGGYSRWQDEDLTRWRADPTLDHWGMWIYVQDRESGSLWSVTQQPTPCPRASQDVRFSAHLAEFLCHRHAISIRTEIAVAPEDDVEIRRLTLSNEGERSRSLFLTSYGEVVLADHAADRRHPAFGNLSIESEYLPEVNGQLFHRRPESAEAKPVYLLHSVVTQRGHPISGEHEADRQRFLGRGGSPRAPACLGEGGHGLSGTTGATLDPIMAVGQEVFLGPYASVQVAYLTAAARSRQEAVTLGRRYQAWSAIRRAFEGAHSHAEIELRQLGINSAQLEQFMRLLSVLLYPHAALRAGASVLAANRMGQPGLWGYAISGDHPILLVRVSDQEGMQLVREMLQAHALWRQGQTKVDLVILNEHEISYGQELQGQLLRLVVEAEAENWLNQRGGIFLLVAHQLSQADRTLLETAARAILDAKAGTLGEQLGRLRIQPERLPRFTPLRPGPGEEQTRPLGRPTDLLFDNGLGGFRADGREYLIYLRPGQSTPSPWTNVVANPQFGFLVSETGAGYTWAVNSGENRLTPWSNDPVSDAPGEALYLRDEESGEIWSPTPAPAGAPAPYLIRHGAGYSIFEHHSHGLRQRLRLFAVPDAPVKVVHLRMENLWDRGRRITVTFYAEWVLGTTREETQAYIVSEFDSDTGALLARNAYNSDFGERVAFLAASQPPHGLTADRSEFLGRCENLERPAGLGRVGLAGTVQAGIDPCAAIQVHMDLSPGEAKEIYFLLGEGRNREETLQLVSQFGQAAEVAAAWEGVSSFWDGFLGAVTVRTPDPAMDLLLNRWLLYQTLSCRLWARSALYQPGGAYGYRDQLQDVMALVHANPDFTRAHILDAARHQFEQGDVLHWWHPPLGRGVRTRCCDDLLWLPYVTAHYIEATGDTSALMEKVPFLAGAPLTSDESERYGLHPRSDESFMLYEHCRRALDRALALGAHGLPLIGSGDWNDGLNRLGVGGQGESVWAGWFLSAALTRFAPLCQLMGEVAQADEYRNRADEVRRAAETHAWDGAWYRRAFDDEGGPIGSAQDRECQIDSIAQSWAVLSGAADPARSRQALTSAATRLIREDDQLVLLLAPPFDQTARDVGYIKAYPPGIRENGGQYTHAGLWLAWAFAELGQGDRAEGLFRMLNPIYHADAPDRSALYRVEPYVVAADICGLAPHVGRGGWTWYTGSAGWMYRLGLERILGLRRAGTTLRFDPCIPADWSSYELIYRYGRSSYRIAVENPKGVNRGVWQVTLDGRVLPDKDIPLLGDGRQHLVRVVMG